MGNQILTAQAIADRAHAHQVDKAGKPYINHLRRVVAILLRDHPAASDDEIAAAWLHDVLEDTPVESGHLLLCGMPLATVLLVEELTRPFNAHYLAWIEHIAGRGTLPAVRIKLADNEDNSDLARVAAIPEGPGLLAKRYAPARRMLLARMERETRDA